MPPANDGINNVGTEKKHVYGQMLFSLCQPFHKNYSLRHKLIDDGQKNVNHWHDGIAVMRNY